MNDLLADWQKEQLKKNLELVGENVCLRQIQEECTELATAISHHFRSEKRNIGELMEETADMVICLQQLIDFHLANGARLDDLKQYVDAGFKKLKQKEVYYAHSQTKQK